MRIAAHHFLADGFCSPPDKPEATGNTVDDLHKGVTAHDCSGKGVMPGTAGNGEVVITVINAPQRVAGCDAIPDDRVYDVFCFGGGLANGLQAFDFDVQICYGTPQFTTIAGKFPVREGEAFHSRRRKAVTGAVVFNVREQRALIVREAAAVGVDVGAGFHADGQCRQADDDGDEKWFYHNFSF